MIKSYTTFEIFPSQKLIIEYYAGDISVDILIGIKKEISKHESYNPNYNLIMDMRNSNFLYEREAVTEFTKFFKSFHAIIGRRKVAYLTGKPNEVVATKVFAQLIGDLEINAQTFSTVPAIVSWFNISDFTEDEFEQIIDRLRSKL